MSYNSPPLSYKWLLSGSFHCWGFMHFKVFVKEDSHVYSVCHLEPDVLESAFLHPLMFENYCMEW